MIEIEAPDGAIVEFPDGTPDAVIERAMQQAYGTQGAAPKQDRLPAKSQQMEHPLGGAFNAATEGSQAGLLGGFDDELTAAVWSPFRAGADWIAGKGFDIPRAYSEKQSELDAMKAQRREQHPIASIAGEVAGGLALGSVPGKAGATLAGRSVPLLRNVAPRTAAMIPAAAEGAAYGGLYGAGEAKPGERLAGAGSGAVIGGLTAGALQGVGNALATRSGRKAAQAAAPSADDLASVSHGLYRAAENEGVRYKAPAVQRLASNLKVAAGRTNDRLRPKTAGFMDDIDNLFTGDMSLEAFDEFRKSLNKEIARATPDDGRTLTAMKRVADSFVDNVGPGEFTGDSRKAVGILKQARETWARSKKAEVVERILDFADVDGKGRYTQSGFANAVRQEMKNLYKSIARGKQKGWTKDEVALIRQMGRGGSNSAIINLFAKFAPRGVVSGLAGPTVGSLLAGPVGTIAVPAVGHMAGRAADSGAMAAAQALRVGTATGTVPSILPQATARTGIAIPGLVAPSMGTGRSLTR